MQTDRWQKIEEIFNRAVVLPAAQRTEFITAACNGDESLRQEVLELLEADTAEENPLDEDVFTLALECLEHEDLLPAGAQIAHYRIEKLIGRGGMGAVFLARDTRLEREIALKILPAHFAGNRQNIERFRQEARAASAVSHPNVAHIYEFGAEDERYFLAMEYVAGKTLRELLRENAIDDARALEIASQLAGALSVMHRSGIIHRDIKPENIIITDDGQVKILDFGLAKYSPERRANSLETSLETVPGMVLGTSAYMSPEQVRGQALDQRTDIWSLAVIFYEMIFGARPFAGESASDIHAAVLRDEANLDGAPAGLRDFFARAFQKNPALRFQTVEEFAAALEKIEKSNFKTNLRRFLNPSKAGQNDFPAAKRNLILFAGTLLIALCVIGGAYLWRTTNSAPKDFTLTGGKRLTSSGKMKYAALTRDAEVLAYSLEELGGRTIYLAYKNPQTREFDQPPRVLFPASRNIVSQLAFTPDKRFLYFKMREPDKSFGNLYRLSIDGAASAPEKVLDDIQNAPSFSPDGRQIVFLRLSRDNSHETLFIADAENGSNERQLYTRARPGFIPDTAQPAWSPDGKTILCAIGNYADDAESYNVLAIDAESGAAREILTGFWAEIWATAWTNGGKSFVFTGHNEKLADNNQLWLTDYATGSTRRLTDDYNDYFTVSTADTEPDGQSELVSIILQRRAQIYRADLNDPAASATLLTPEGDYGYGISVSANETLFYGSTQAGNPDIWTMSPNGENQRQLTFDPKLDSQPLVVPNSEFVVFGSYRSGTEGLWRMTAGGGAQTLLASNVVRDSLAVSPDGLFVYYRSNAKESEAVWRVAVAGGAPEKFAAGNYKSLAVSPDGKLLAATLDENETDAPQMAILKIDAPQEKPKIFPLADGALPLEKIRFTPDGKSVAYIAVQKGIGNIWSQNLAEIAPKSLTDFKTNNIYSFDFSPNGKQIFCSRGELNGYSVRFTLK